VAIGGFDYIFYIDGSGALAYRKSTDPNEGASKKYTDNSISTASDPAIMVNETAPSVAAVAYQDAQNQNQVA
jgi:hypothetical protein